MEHTQRWLARETLLAELIGPGQDEPGVVEALDAYDKETRANLDALVEAAEVVDERHRWGGINGVTTEGIEALAALLAAVEKAKSSTTVHWRSGSTTTFTKGTEDDRLIGSSPPPGQAQP